MMGEKTGSKAKRDSRDLTGRQFGKLKVMERLSERESRYVVYLCRCECGNEVRVASITMIPILRLRWPCSSRTAGRSMHKANPSIPRRMTSAIKRSTAS